MTPTNKNYIGATLISISLFGLIALAWPEYSSISIIRAGIIEMEKNKAMATTALENIKNIKKEYESRGPIVAKVTKLIPQRKNTEEIISTIESIISITGVRLSRLAVGDAKSQSSLPYNLSPIELTINGAYPSISIFLKTIESNIRLLDVTSVQMGKDQQNPGQLSFKISISGYYLKNDAPTINK